MINWGLALITGGASLLVEGASEIFTGKSIDDNVSDWWDEVSGKNDAREANRKAREQSAKGFLSTRTGQIEYLPVVYGTRRLGGVEIFRSSAGTRTDNVEGQSVNIDNAYLWRIVVHSVEATSASDYEIDEVPVTVDASGAVTDTTYAGYAWFASSPDGVSGISSHPLWAEFRAAVGSDWTDDDKLIDVCFTLQKLAWDRDTYSGIPTVTTLVTGKTDNAVDAVIDYLQSTTYGLGIPPAEFNTVDNSTASATAGASYNLWGTTFGKRFEMNAAIDTGTEIFDNVYSNMLDAARAKLSYTEDGWTIRLKDQPQTPVALTEDDIIGSVQYQLGKVESRITRVVVKFVNRLNRYKDDEVYYPTDDVQFQAALAEDNGKYKEQTYNATWCTDQAHAEDYAKWLWTKNREGKAISMTVGTIGFKLESSDVIAVTLPSADLAGDLFQITSIEYDKDSVAFKIDAMPYDASLATGDTIATPVVATPPEVSDARVVSAPSGLSVSQGKYLSAGEVVLSWTPSTNQYVQKYSGYLIPLNDPDNLLDDGSKIPFTVSSRERSVKFGYLKEGDYTAYVKAESDLSSSPYTTFGFTVTIPKVPAVRRLELFGQANDDQFVGQDAKFSWAQISIQEFYDLGYEPVNQGAGAGALDYYLEGYEVTVEDIDGTVRRVDFVKENQYTYSFEKNLEDANRSASDAIEVVRTFRVKVKAKTKQNLFSETAAVIEVENIAPESPSGIAVEEDFYQAFLSYTAPTDPDWQGVEVHLSTSAGFTPSAATLVGKGPDTSWKLKNLTMETTYYLKLVPYDVFGAGTTSSEFSFTTTKLTGASITDVQPETIISGSLGVELNLQAGGFIKTLHTEGASTFETYQGLVDRPSVSSLPLTFHQWNPGNLTSNFSVDAGGTLRAEGAIIEGEIVATSLTLADSTVVTGVDEITGNQIVYVYQTSASQPATPTGTNPAGWSTTPTARVTGQYVWVSQATKKNTGELIGAWSTPVEFTGDQGDQGIQGPQGVQGPAGADGQSLYTWIKYGDDAAGTGITDNPLGKAYIGVAYNNTSPTESTNPADYTWSKIEGDQGIQGPSGADGQSLYTWIKYGDDAIGTGLSDSPVGKSYIGIAYNKSTASESTNPADYAWSKMEGDQGATGPQGPQGPQGDPGILPAPDNVNPGLYADSTHLGYHDSGAWKTYMDNTGKFFLTGTSGNSLYWDGVDTLTVDGDVNAKTLSLSGGTVAPSVSGLYGDQSRIGYWDSVEGWQNYIAADGSFRVNGLGAIELDASGRLTISSGKASSQDASPGLWLGVDADNVAKVSMGDSVSFLRWDGDDLSVSGVLSRVLSRAMVDTFDIAVSDTGYIWSDSCTNVSGQQVVVGQQTSSPYSCIINDDGSYTTNAMTGSGNPRGVVSVGGSIVAVGWGALWRSTTGGATWTQSTVAGAFDKVVYGSGVYIAVGGVSSLPSSAAAILRSTDGVTFSPVTAPSVNRLTSVVYSKASGRFVAVSPDSGKLVYSTDGVTWSVGASITTSTSGGMSYDEVDGVVTIAIGTQVYNSDNGETVDALGSTSSTVRASDFIPQFNLTVVCGLTSSDISYLKFPDRLSKVSPGLYGQHARWNPVQGRLYTGTASTILRTI